MFKITAKLNAPSLNSVAYVAQLESTARDLLSRAMLEYLVTFQTIVPVWSGASHATLTSLAQIVSAPLAIVPSSTAFNGTAFGASRGDAYFGDKNGRFVFSFETDLPHLVYNESTNANINPDPGLRGKLLNPGPYHFVKHTSDAVQVVLRQFVPPDLNNSIRPKRIK